jgi:hypothetical protein
LRERKKGKISAAGGTETDKIEKTSGNQTDKYEKNKQTISRKSGRGKKEQKTTAESRTIRETKLRQKMS